jgi:uncharacterized repeat protein (TIGR04042 family)
MPAMYYRLRWPDTSESHCYSPSLVIKDFFAVGEALPLPEFLRRLREATEIASQRVEAKYGFRCTRAEGQLQIIEHRAAAFTGQNGALVHMLAFDENV